MIHGCRAMQHANHRRGCSAIIDAHCQSTSKSLGRTQIGSPSAASTRATYIRHRLPHTIRTLPSTPSNPLLQLGQKTRVHGAHLTDRGKTDSISTMLCLAGGKLSFI